MDGLSRQMWMVVDKILDELRQIFHPSAERRNFKDKKINDKKDPDASSPLDLSDTHPHWMRKGSGHQWE